MVVTRVAVFGKRMPGKRPLRSPTARAQPRPCAGPSPERSSVLQVHLFATNPLLCWPAVRCRVACVRVVWGVSARVLESAVPSG